MTPGREPEIAGPHASGIAPSDLPAGADLQAVLRVRDTTSLRPHPLYNQLRGTYGDTGPLQASGSSPISEPLLTNVDGTILDGHARWQAAIARRQLTVPCLEYDLTNDEALQVVITRHRRSEGLNAYCRIVLALGLESYFRERRLLTSPKQHAQPSSNLTKRQHRDVRKDVARLAGVATGNVTKVKQLIKSAVPEVLERLRRGQVSIHRAWTWCGLDVREQRDALWTHLNGQGITRTINHLVRAHTSPDAPSRPAGVKHSLLGVLATYAADDLIVSVVDAPGRAVVLTRTCYDELQRRCGQ